MPKSRWLIRLLVVLCISTAPAVGLARIKLITLPVRERVEIQLDNPNATLVEEERIVPLVKGENQVDFSWSNTQINPDTIVFRVLGPAEEKKVEEKPADGNAGDQKAGAAENLDVRVLSVSYPPNEAALVWNVGANRSGSARVRISYLLGNLNKSFNYRAVVAHDESTLVLSEYMRLQNFANEEFGSTGLWAGFGKRFLKPVGVNETKEMLVEKFEGVPVRKTYTCDPEEFGYIDQPKNKLRVPMHYVLKNDKDHHLGAAALQYGKVRIFIEGSGEAKEKSTAFLGEDWGKFTPRDDEMKLYLGVAQDIAVVRTIDHQEQQRVAGNLFNHRVVLKYEIENFKDQPVELDVVENLRHVQRAPPDSGRDVYWELGPETNFDGGPDKEKSTFDRLLFHVKLPARDKETGKAEKVIRKLDVTFKNEW